MRQMVGPYSSPLFFFQLVGGRIAKPVVQQRLPFTEKNKTYTSIGHRPQIIAWKGIIDFSQFVSYTYSYIDFSGQETNINTNIKYR